MGSVEVIPIHLVDADSKHLLIFGADPLSDDPVVDELIDVECGSVGVIEDERMPQRFCSYIVGLFRIDDLKKLFVEWVGL